MPIYEYECDTCGVVFEKRQSFNDEPVADCPQGHSDTRRLISTPAIVFKGSGFYINDSKDAKNSTVSTNASDNSTNGTSNSTTDTKKETKAKEAKKEAKKETASASSD